MMSLLSVGILGAGNIAGGYDEKKLDNKPGVYTHAGAYNKHDGFQIATIYDLDKNRAEEFKAHWNAKNVVIDIKHILEKYHDVLSICTPDETHLELINRILKANCCKTIFVEKPLITDIEQYEAITKLAKGKGINIVVNFQRRYEKVHNEIQQLIQRNPEKVLSVSGKYMKGLHHIGVTLIDTLIFFFGFPSAVQSYNRIWNEEVKDYSYEFIVFYPDFTVSVQTIDSEKYEYNYHLFEIDLLFTDKRKTLIDISQAVRDTNVGEYAYSGVKIMNDRDASISETEYRTSMYDAICYLYDITNYKIMHTINTPAQSYNNLLVIDAIIKSYSSQGIKLNFESQQWKR
jgi:predicted dehydrogenase